MKYPFLFTAYLCSLSCGVYAIQESYDNASLSPYLHDETCQQNGGYNTCSSCLNGPCIFELSDDEFDDDADYPGKKEGDLIDYFSR